MHHNVGLIGKMGAGKDTVADILCSNFGYVRVSFAAPLKQMVIDADPLVMYNTGLCNPLVRDCVPVHLSDLLNSGKTFEECKREYPEVRRSLQRIGQGVRKIDETYWIRLALAEVKFANAHGVPVVVTDCRYWNEAVALDNDGFHLWRITRKPSERGMTMPETEASLHASETQLDGWTPHRTFANDGSKIELAETVLQYVDEHRI